MIRNLFSFLGMPFIFFIDKYKKKEDCLQSFKCDLCDEEPTWLFEEEKRCELHRSMCNWCENKATWYFYNNRKCEKHSPKNTKVFNRERTEKRKNPSNNQVVKENQ